VRIPPYIECDPAELPRIMRWAQRKLSLRDWTLALTTDAATARTAGMTAFDQQFGGVTHYAPTMHAVIAVNLTQCREADISGTRDPRWIVCHEVAHLLTADTAGDLDPDDKHFAAWELLANRIAGVLFDLYEAEGRTP